MKLLKNINKKLAKAKKKNKKNDDKIRERKQLRRMKFEKKN